MTYFKFLLCAGIMLVLSCTAGAQQGYINTFAGGGPNNAPATSAPVDYPADVALDSAGNIYFTTEGGSFQNRVWKITKSTGILTIVAGNFYGYSGDGGLAVNAQLAYPQGLAVDYLGNIFIADQENSIIREVNASTGVINTIAGIPGSSSFSGDGGPATSANLFQPTGVTIDKNGNLFIADYLNQRVRVVACATVTGTGGACTPDAGLNSGDIYTVAGTGTAEYNGDSQAATIAELNYPYGTAVDTDGNLYISDSYNQRIRRVACGTGINGCKAPTGEKSGDIYTIAGKGTDCVNPTDACGDGGPAISASFSFADAVALDNSGNLFISDREDFRIREVSCITTTISGTACTASTGQKAKDIYTVAGNESAISVGDGNPATSAYLSLPVGVAVDSAGDLFIGDEGNGRIREVPCDVSTLACTPPTGDTAQYIYTIAGIGTANFYGNDVPATDAALSEPTYTASDSAGDIFIADTNDCVVREVNVETGEISTIAGVPGMCNNGDSGPATSVYLMYPQGVAVDGSGNAYIADTGNCLIRKVSDGTMSTIAGSAVDGCSYSGDGGPASEALLNGPTGMAVDTSGNLYIADEGNSVIRRISGGNISTFAGNYALGPGFSGDGGPATSAELKYPSDVAVDSFGNVYIADADNLRVRKVNTSGIISTFAGTGSEGYGGDGGPATLTTLDYPNGVAVDGAGDVVIADSGNERLRLVDGAGIIHTIAGDGTAGFSGQDVLATTAELSEPIGVAIDPSGNIYEADYDNWVVRKINALTILNSSPASVAFCTQLVNTTSAVMNVTVAANGTAVISDKGVTAPFTESDNCPGTMTSASTCTASLYFSPTSPGTFNGTFTINYNGFFSTTLTVNLTGTATPLGGYLETFTPGTINFGSQANKVSSAATEVTFTNNGASSLTITKPVPTAGFHVNVTKVAAPVCSVTASTVVASGASCSFNVVFDPTVTGAANGSVKTTFPADAHGNTSLLLNVSGEGSAISFTPASVAIKATLTGTTSAKTKVTIKNVDTVFLTLTSLTSSAPATFVLLDTGLSPACNLGGSTVIPPGGNCVADVAFAPGGTFGTVDGTITANYTGDPNGDTSRVLAVSGIGTEMKETGSLAFGTVASPATKILSATVTNEGTASSTITAPTITGTGAAEYSMLAYDGTHSTCLNGSVSLTHLQACTISVQFTPPAGSGTSYAADLNINSTGGGPLVVAISGKN